MGQIWARKANLSGVAKIPFSTTTSFYDELIGAENIIAAQSAWNETRGGYEAVPRIRFYAGQVHPFATSDDYADEVPLLALATTLFLIPKKNYTHMCTLAGSGDNANGVVGPGGDDHITSGPFWQSKLATVELSGAVGGGRYPTFSELGTRLNKFYIGSGVADLLRAVADPVLLTDADRAHETFVYLLRFLFTKASTKTAIQYITALRHAMLRKAVESCEYDVDSETFIMNCTIDFAKFFKKRRTEITEYTPWLVAEVVYGWITNVNDDGKFVEVDGHRLQHIDPDSLYARVLEWSGVRKVRIKNTEESLDEIVEDDGSKDLEPDDTDVKSDPDIALIYEKGDNAIIWNPPKLQPVEGCGRLEDNGSPIALAAEIGLAQQSEKQLLELFTDYLDWSDKKKKKKLKMMEVVPDLQDELARLECRVWIPKPSVNQHEKNLSAQASKMYTQWWEAAGSALFNAVQENIHDYTYTSEGVEYLIDRTGFLDYVRPTLKTVLHEDPEVESKWLTEVVAGRELWNSMLAGDPPVEVVCLPASEFKPEIVTRPKRDTFSTFECSRIITATTNAYVNNNELAKLFATEHEHCVEAYKKRAEAYMVIGALVGGGKANWYWLLLLLIIPITVLAIAVANKDSSNNT